MHLGHAAGAGYLPRVSSRPLVYLHVGEPKTGSTHIQQVMWRNRAALAMSGVMLPGPRPLAHWRATQDLREVPQAPNDPIGPNAGAWDRLVRQALRAPRAAVISHELLAAASEEQARHAIASLGDAEIHVIVGVRDFATLLPAEWQESVKHRCTTPWQDWLGDVIDREADDPDRRQYWFWRVHDTLEILRIWSAGLPQDQVHVVTVPPRGSEPDLLWRRFAGLIGADHEGVDISRAAANASLGLAEVELLRRINLELPAEIPDWFYMRSVKDSVAADALARQAEPERLELPHDRFAWAAAESERVADGLREAGFHIVGDLADLAPRRNAGSRASDELDDAELLRPALAVIAGLLTGLAADQGVPTEPAPADAPHPRRRWSLVKRAGVAASMRSSSAHRLRRGYWRLANRARRNRAGQANEGEWR
jgi:hypothetical protein